MTALVIGGTLGKLSGSPHERLSERLLMNMHRLKLARILLAGIWVSIATSCGDNLATPTEGSIRIETTTSGVDLDTDGYTVTVDDAQGVAIGNSDRLVVNDLGLGNHQVTLAALAANCTPGEGGNPQTVAVVGGDTVTVAFQVICSSVDGGGGGGGGASALWPR